MVAKVRFWLQESSRLIAKASLSVMILKSAFLNSLFTTKESPSHTKHLLQIPQRLGHKKYIN